MLEAKSAQVEEAANELVDMLWVPDEDDEVKEIEFEREESNYGDKPDASAPDSDREAPDTPSLRSNSKIGSPMTAAGRAIQRRKELRDNLKMAAQELISHFNQSNLNALLQVTRSILDAIKRRVTISTRNYIDRGDVNRSLSATSYEVRRNEKVPCFRVKAVLSIPNVVMQPTLEEVQQAVNRACHHVLSVSRNVSQWGQERRRLYADQDRNMYESQGVRSRSVSNAASDDSRTDISAIRSRGSRNNAQGDGAGDTATLGSVIEPKKNYYKNIAENKDIAKQVSMLSTAIMSTKKDITTALEAFYCYEILWQKDREEAIKEFIEGNPNLTEFEAEILYYQRMEKEIVGLPESYNVGAIALYTGKRPLLF